MNAKQFIGSAVTHVVDLYPRIRRFFSDLAHFVYPDFERYPVFTESMGNIKFVYAYLFIFFFLFVMQAFWAYKYDRFWPDSDPSTKNFLEDWVDIINYVAICEAYLIIGYQFLKSSYRVTAKLIENGVLPPTQNIQDVSPIKNLSAVSLVLLSGIIATLGYFNEVKTYTYHFWFMQPSEYVVAMDSGGIYYIIISLLLMLFVSWVIFAHFGLFRIAGKISENLQLIHKMIEKDSEEVTIWSDENIIKKMLHPFAVQILYSKAFVLVVTLNLLLWKYNDSNVSYMFDISVIVAAILGIWVFSLPRYYVQYYVFLIWQKIGKEEYKDMRMPWILGSSAFIDVVLIAILINKLLGETWSKLLDKLFS
jgi:hypothetical protein